MTRILIIQCICFLLLACDQGKNNYYPLQGGYYWRYQMHYQIMNGPDDTFYIIENMPPVKDDKGWIYEQLTMDGRSYYYRNDNAGLLLTRRSRHLDLTDDIREINRYLFQYPLEQGRQWQSETYSRVLIRIGPPQKTEFQIVAKVPVAVTIESMTDTVKVPAGVFKNCMRIKSKGKSFIDAGNYVGNTVVGIDETSWYAPGVGLIKSVRKETTTAKALDYGEIILELETFRKN